MLIFQDVLLCFILVMIVLCLFVVTRFSTEYVTPAVQISANANIRLCPQTSAFVFLSLIFPQGLNYWASSTYIHQGSLCEHATLRLHYYTLRVSLPQVYTWLHTVSYIFSGHHSQIRRRREVEGLFPYRSTVSFYPKLPWILSCPFWCICLLNPLWEIEFWTLWAGHVPPKLLN